MSPFDFSHNPISFEVSRVVQPVVTAAFAPPASESVKRTINRCGSQAQCAQATDRLQRPIPGFGGQPPALANSVQRESTDAAVAKKRSSCTEFMLRNYSCFSVRKAMPSRPFAGFPTLSTTLSTGRRHLPTARVGLIHRPLQIFHWAIPHRLARLQSVVERRRLAGNGEPRRSLNQEASSQGRGHSRLEWLKGGRYRASGAGRNPARGAGSNRASASFGRDGRATGRRRGKAS